MSDSANTFTSLKAMFKESYSDGSMKTHERPGSNGAAYNDKIHKLMEKPQSSKQYYAHIKKYLKKAARGTKS